MSPAISSGAPGSEVPEIMVTFTEMLPTPEQCWLMDAEGNRYASELRTIGVSPKPWRWPVG